MNEHCSEILKEIKDWIEDDFKPNPLIEILTDQSQGQGFMGSIIFAKCSCKCDNKLVLNVVIKCSQTNEKLRKVTAASFCFRNEIYTYEKVLPKLQEIAGEFEFVPKYYGSIVWENREVLVLENLNEIGYNVYPPKIPMKENDLRSVLKALAKYHASSAAIKQKRPEEFTQIVENLTDLWEIFPKLSDQSVTLGGPLEMTYELLKNDLDPESANKLKNFRKNVNYIVDEIMTRKDCFTVISHSDCWINNLMFRYKNNSTDVIIIDWPNTRLSSPIYDLSFCIYSSASAEDISKLEELLKFYHSNFSTYLRQFDCDPDSTYKYSQLLEDWKIFAKMGVLMATVAIKIGVSDKEEIADFGDIVGRDGDISQSFIGDVKDKETWRRRIKPVIENAIRFEVI